MTSASIPATFTLAELASALSRQEAFDGPTTSLGVADNGTQFNYASFLDRQPLPNAIDLVAVPLDADLVQAISSRGSGWMLAIVTHVWIASVVTRVAVFRQR